MRVAAPSYYIWMVFLLPYAGALVTPLLAKLPSARDYASVSIALVSALFAFLQLFSVLQGQSVTLFNSFIPSSLS